MINETMCLIGAPIWNGTINVTKTICLNENDFGFYRWSSIISLTTFIIIIVIGLLIWYYDTKHGKKKKNKK